MRTTWVTAAALTAVGAIVACSSGTSSGTGTGGGPTDGDGGSSSSGGSGSSSGSASGSSSGGTASAGVSLSVTSAVSPETVGGVYPSAGGSWAIVNLTLKNTGAGRALSTNPALFSLQTGQSLVISASPEQAPSECSASVSVAGGGQDTCAVAFMLAAGQTPATLVYDDLQGDTASVPFAVSPPSAACETLEGWVQGKSPSGACVECLDHVYPMDDIPSAACSSAGTAYESTCQSCKDQCPLNYLYGSDGEESCKCYLACTSSCQSLFQTYLTCATTACSSSCP